MLYITQASLTIERATRALRHHAFRTVLQTDIGFFDKTGRDTVVAGLSDHLLAVRDAVTENLSRDRGLRCMLDVLFGTSLSFVVTGAVGAPVFGVVVPVLSTVVARMGMRHGRLVGRMVGQEVTVRGFLTEKMSGVRTVKAFGAERREGTVFGRLLDAVGVIARSVARSKAVTEVANRVSIYATIIIFFLMGGFMICAGTLTFEQFSCMTGFIWILNFAMQGVSYTITDLTKMNTSLNKIFTLVDNAQRYNIAKSTQQTTQPMRQPSTIRGEVKFNDVCFHYPSRPDVTVLKGINLSIKPGQMVALVGNSGGGKSTIAAILSRFYKPTSGSVTLDGHDIHALSPELFAKQIAVVDQDPVLFQGTIRENIAYGLPDEELDDQTIVQAAVEANAHSFILKLSKGYDTIWTPASNLSGGQRQRIAIARSLIKSPPILILDEATSALDQESERMVQAALERVMKNRSVLLIAHRLTTVRKADAILFIKDGKVVEQGTYDELLNRPNGYFRALVQSASEVIDNTARTI